MPSFPAKEIIFVVFPEVKLLDLTGPMQVFADANLVSPGTYDLELVSLTGGEIDTDTIASIVTQPMSSVTNQPIDTLIVAGGSGAFAASEDVVFIREILRIGTSARRIGSVCTGAFILAKAGILNGLRAVTHWDSCDRLRDNFQDITVKDDAIFVQDGNIWTSAGVTAGIDMSLAMVAEDIGRKKALDLARALLCYMVRPGGQSQFSARLIQQSQNASGQFEDLHTWITDHLSADLSVEALAAQAAMSPRNFARLYKQQTGISPAKSVEEFRVDAACQLLEETNFSLLEIASKCGFHDDERLRRAMIRRRNVAPGEYRERFGV
jgi:transcriptional regulator GlxA family with amidase domain